ncbi:inactive hydroxysteroid dehydrogenase-like protein 1 [Cuculus canorus]|uniref:inactive hydroxysteroid dehydrogenase-like protein 1 n=1 Tax=Cuculus canorus TaxID=55661 RepID=UPI0023AA966A|nr:inactive hydroxysteroid dehydrogenase-like protein 1 [Cuculus canorus]
MITMAAVDHFHLLYREISRSLQCLLGALALVGAWYTVQKVCVSAVDTYSMLRLHFIPKLGGKIDLVKQYGKWAVITGSTDGIGKAYAEELAKRGVNIILISRNKEKLEALCKSISETYKVETLFIVADFSKGREPYSAIKEALKDTEIGILVNNVGIFYPYPDYFTNLSEDILWDMININIASANMMTHIVLPGMVKKKKGAIVNVSSASCCQPTPMLAAYGASKLNCAGASQLFAHYIFAQSSTVTNQATASPNTEGQKDSCTIVCTIFSQKRTSTVIIFPEEIQSIMNRMEQLGDAGSMNAHEDADLSWMTCC